MDLIYSNKRGDTLSLTDNEYFYLTNVDGQTEANTALSSFVTGGVDGDTVTSVRAQPRTIVLDLRIKSGVDVETAKRVILNIVKLKQTGSLTWTQNDREVIISGVVESVEMPRWNKAVTMQISLYCEQPFWEDIDNVIQDIVAFVDTHYFTTDEADMLFFTSDGMALGEYNTSRTQTFQNDGDVAIGIEITIQAFGTVTNPIIYDTDGNFFGVGYGTGNKQVVMESGDIIVITTHKGNKTVKLNGVSIFDKIKPQSFWLQLQPGANQFRIDSDDTLIDNMMYNLQYKQRYI